MEIDVKPFFGLPMDGETGLAGLRRRAEEDGRAVQSTKNGSCIAIGEDSSMPAVSR